MTPKKTLSGAQTGAEHPNEAAQATPTSIGKPLANEWGGQDVRTSTGVARWIMDDVGRAVYRFTPNMALEWQVHISQHAPKDVFQAVWLSAQR
jgi:hypothetical protein